MKLDGDLEAKPETKVLKLFRILSEQIEENKLNAGDSLLSIRKASVEFDVSKNTVVEVYDKLVAAGLIVSKPNSGYVVSKINKKNSDNKLNEIKSAHDTVSLLEAQINKNFLVDVGSGRPPDSWMTDIWPFKPSKNKSTEVSSGYSSVWGFGPLREDISFKASIRGLDCSSDQIVTTSGANHAIDLIIRTFLKPGDTVFVDDPGYFPLYAKLKLSHINFVGIPRTSAGIDIEYFKEKLLACKPVLFFTQSVGQNPTGSSYTLHNAHNLLMLAEEHRFLIVDDDPFYDLPCVQGIRLSELDQFNKVILIVTFSKILSSTVRSGYIVSKIDIAEQLANVKLITVVNSSTYSEAIIHNIRESSGYVKHIRKMTKRINLETHEIQEKLKNCGIFVRYPPTFGFYMLLDLPEGVNDLQLSKQAAKKSIFIAPGSLFKIKPNKNDASIRINVTRSNDKRFFNFLQSAIHDLK